MIVTPTARIPSHKTKCDEEQKLVKALRIGGSVIQSQCALGVGPSSSRFIPAWMCLHKGEDTWTEVFGCISRILGTFVITQSQIKTLLNDLFSKSRSPLVLSDDSVRSILFRANRVCDVDIIEEKNLQSIIDESSKPLRILYEGYNYVYKLLLTLFDDLMIASVQARSASYVVINRRSLNNCLGTMIQNMKENRFKTQDLMPTSQPLEPADHCFLPVSTLMVAYLEPVFPGLATLSTVLREAATWIAVDVLKQHHQAVEVKRGYLLIPFPSGGGGGSNSSNGANQSVLRLDPGSSRSVRATKQRGGGGKTTR
eukprot:Protomagalhaensia_sp_Gyna_25__2217@NODE_2203_length_1224_cov_22_208439_g1824_i0_p1_GENE_NODE_2203_length_1224_cov_22_208439_g1824_i0NODE_2203_length_1224_cov_22_208439_g1824_i0_p1_ORF_typecomplete_len312_score26_62GatB_Yqey/PF02637_18/0_15GatB_Yqey/PF02637_18/7_3e03_NODE_2203_length_1224_cov_22_208439_g1824_i039974